MKGKKFMFIYVHILSQEIVSKNVSRQPSGTLPERLSNLRPKLEL